MLAPIRISSGCMSDYFPAVKAVKKMTDAPKIDKYFRLVFHKRSMILELLRILVLGSE